MEYYSVIKRNEVLIHAPAWMNIENIMLSERSQTQKTTYCVLLFIGNVQNTESTLVAARCWWEGVKGSDC